MTEESICLYPSPPNGWRQEMRVMMISRMMTMKYFYNNTAKREDTRRMKMRCRKMERKRKRQSFKIAMRHPQV